MLQLILQGSGIVSRNISLALSKFSMISRLSAYLLLLSYELLITLSSLIVIMSDWFIHPRCLVYSHKKHHHICVIRSSLCPFSIAILKFWNVFLCVIMIYSIGHSFSPRPLSAFCSCLRVAESPVCIGSSHCCLIWSCLLSWVPPNTQRVHSPSVLHTFVLAQHVLITFLVSET